ncbi:MAG: hypothetical protein JXB17_04995 [Bacteroidales bacterium]|nr:hypothetical protein [Bacteroidales bacterium]
MKIDNYDNVLKWSYSLARQWAMDNLVPEGITSSRKFDFYKKERKYLPKHFPRRPDDYFRMRGTWKGWPDFFGNPVYNFKKDYFDYNTALRVTRTAGIKNSKDFKNWRKRPTKIPARPDQYYKDNWQNWKIFLGNNYYVPKPRNYSKLTESDVKIIKHQLTLGVPGAALAKHFGVSEMQISRIKRNENWTDINL